MGVLAAEGLVKLFVLVMVVVEVDLRIEGLGLVRLNLVNVCRGVVLLHMPDDVAATRLAHVDIEVRHRDSLRVEEALEEEVEAERIKIGYLNAVGDEGSRARAAPRADGDAVVLRPLDKLHHDEEVAGEAHLDDDLELFAESFLVARHLLLPLLRIGVEELHPPEEALDGLSYKRALLGVLGLVLRQEIVSGPDGDAAAPRDLDRVLEGLRDVAEELAHLLLGLQVLLRAEALRPSRIGHDVAVMERDSDLVGLEVLFVKEHAVVGRDNREILPERSVKLEVVAPFLVRAPGADELKVVPVGEVLLVERYPLGGLLPVALQEEAADIALASAREHDDAL